MGPCQAENCLFLSFHSFLSLTLLAEGNSVVHSPADQCHEKPQEDEEDPVFTHTGNQELLTS